MEEFLLAHGYWLMGSFLFAKSLPIAGGFFSGNTALYLSALLAGVGEFRISLIIVIGLCVVLVGDSLMFLTGKYFNDKFPRLRKAQDKIQPWLEKTQNGENKFTYFYMHAGALRAYLPFFLGYSKMSNAQWFRKVSISAVLFVPVIAAIGFTVGSLNISTSSKAIISGILWVVSTSIFAKVSHQLYSSFSDNSK